MMPLTSRKSQRVKMTNLRRKKTGEKMLKTKKGEKRTKKVCWGKKRKR